MQDGPVFYNKPSQRFESLFRWLPSLIILPIAYYFVINRGHYGLLDNTDLVIHEAGHFFLFFFGRFVQTIGGTLIQIALPSLIAWHFARNSYRTGVQFSLLWLGQNLINISIYAADAQERSLPLLGGSRVYHDWHYMLGTLGILQYDDTVGYIFYGIAIIIFIIAIFLPLKLSD